MRDDDGKIILIELITSYYSFTLSDILKSVWLKDFFSYSAQQIETAFDRWRSDEATRNKKPKSYDLVKIIKTDLKKNDFGFVETKRIETEVVPEGSETNLRLKSDLKKMHEAMPDLLDRVRECTSVGEKITLCAVALGKPELVNEPFAQMLINGVKERMSGNREVPEGYRYSAIGGVVISS